MSSIEKRRIDNCVKNIDARIYEIKRLVESHDFSYAQLRCTELASQLDAINRMANRLADAEDDENASA